MQMKEQTQMEISHVLYKTNDLHKAVKQLMSAGFIVEYGTKPGKAYNAMIWFEEGAFIEIFKSPKTSFFAKALMNLLGYKMLLKRIAKWNETATGWCEWSVESENVNLLKEAQILKAKGIAYKKHVGKRTDYFGRKLRWHLIFPKNLDQPFLMSAYTPDPRPKKVRHPNGIKNISLVFVGSEGFHPEMLDELHFNKEKIHLIKGKTGLQTVAFRDSHLRIEEILN